MPHFVEIEGCNARPGKPADWDENEKGPCGALPIVVEQDPDGSVHMTSEWCFSPEEVAALYQGGRLRLRIYGIGHPVVALWVEAKDT